MTAPLLVLAAVSLGAPGSLPDAELALARRIRAVGLASAFRERAAPDAVLLYPGAPVVTDRAAGHTLLAAQPLLDSLALELAPTDAWLSAAGTFGITQGYVDLTPSHGRRGTYLAGWRREGDEWRLVGLMLAGVAPPDRPVRRPDGPIELPPLDPAGPTAAMVLADREFAALAGRAGAAEAFGAYAAPDAVVLGAQGPRRGPAAIGASIGRGPPADWSWTPVAARGAPEGDLGFTVGQAVIAPRDGGDPSWSKYLTAWRRQPDGAMRFLTDGGNPRPRRP